MIEEIGARLDQEEREARDAEIADRIRREVAQIAMLDRLRAAEGQGVVLHLAPDRVHRGTIRQVGADWLLIAEPAGECLVALRHVQTIDGLGTLTAAALQAPARRIFEGMDLRYALRGIAVDRAQVRVGLAGGAELTGTIDRVGADFIDVAIHAVGELRRSSQVTGRTTIALPALVEVVRLGG
ncbi:hypothetical protein GCM10027298_07730 [Epidermidibacterium keratini]